MQENISNVKAKGSKIFTEGIVLAGITLFGYLVAYCYELAYLSFFGAPISLAKIETLTVVIAMGSFVLGSFAILNLLSAIITALHKGATTRVQKFIVQWIIMFLIIVGIPILIFGKHWQVWIGFVLIWLIYFLLDFLWPLIIYRKQGSFEKRLEKSYEDDAKANAKTVTDLLFDKFGLKSVGIFLLAICSLFISGAVGYRNAMNQENFFVLGLDPELTVIYINESHIIAAPFSRDSKKFTQKLRIFTLDQIANEKITMTLESIGPLTLEKTDDGH